jgi:hypothetical protein
MTRWISAYVTASTPPTLHQTEIRCISLVPNELCCVDNFSGLFYEAATTKFIQRLIGWDLEGRGRSLIKVRLFLCLTN